MLLESIALGSGALFLYHHFGYPHLLRRLARVSRQRPPAAILPEDRLPSMTVIVPAYNEAAVIKEKIANLALLNYPQGQLRVVVACDGSRDGTPDLARAAIAVCADPMRFTLVEHVLNRGKVSVLNEAIGASRDELIVLSDTSAMLDPDALVLIAAEFADAEVGVVCPSYRLARPGSEGERAYWSYQTRIKADEAAVGAPMGAHGACYAFRRALWQPLEPDTINDDFIMPMRIVAAGHAARYCPWIVALEAEETQAEQEFRRRVRIGAGNMQQAVRLWRLADMSRPGLAFVFLSGKALRSIMPFLILSGLLAVATLAIGGHEMFQLLLLAAIATLALAAFAVARRSSALPRPLVWLGYLMEGHTAALLGAARYLLGKDRMPWRPALVVEKPRAATFIPGSVEASKRAVDIICGLGALAVLVVLVVPIAVAIKTTSRGPIFYRQLRVGRQTPEATHLFELIKFRTMYIDAEARSGAVWATKNDPRITPVGRFMRKTRLDELPQCFNVLKGEMSVIGPRPERPVFFKRLEGAIPFYTERTFGLKPGITGLAQVNQPYDESIEDVRNKVLYDHAYAARLTSWVEWLRTDFGIIFKTVQVMALGKGQ